MPSLSESYNNSGPRECYAMLCQADSAVMHTVIVALSLIVISHTHAIPLLLMPTWDNKTLFVYGLTTVMLCLKYV